MSLREELRDLRWAGWGEGKENGRMCSNEPENRAKPLRHTGGPGIVLHFSRAVGKGKQSRWSRRAGGSLGVEGKLEIMGCQRTRRGMGSLRGRLRSSVLCKHQLNSLCDVRDRIKTPAGLWGQDGICPRNSHKPIFSVF